MPRFLLPYLWMVTRWGFAISFACLGLSFAAWLLLGETMPGNHIQDLGLAIGLFSSIPCIVYGVETWIRPLICRLLGIDDERWW